MMMTKILSMDASISTLVILNYVFIVAAMVLVALLYLRLMKYLKLKIKELENK